MKPKTPEAAKRGRARETLTVGLGAATQIWQLPHDPFGERLTKHRGNHKTQTTAWEPCPTWTSQSFQGKVELVGQQQQGCMENADPLPLSSLTP